MYNLHQLGWNSFQQLCLTVTREILGQTVESFLDVHDGGRDGAFTGKWTAEGSEDICGPFIIQCKFTSRSGHNLTASDLFDEVEKAGRLVSRGMCESYVLMTNAGLTGAQHEQISKLFNDAGVKHIRVFGSTWLTQQIVENKRLRMLVPRLYGLGDLSQILDERDYAQARSVIESMREDLSKVVVTDAYQKAAEAIDKHGFVLLIGEPASGKTTIASLLSMASIDQWNASVLKLEDPDSVLHRWNPYEPSQFFWLDDVFGVTQYDDSQARRWNHALPRLMPMIRSGAKVVMTSRDYIYNRARRDLKESAFPLLNESQVVIDVQGLSDEEKKQILYNHIKLGTQPYSFRKRIKPFLESIASNSRFIPETARRLGDPLFTKQLLITADGIKQFVEEREEQLQEILRSLDTDSRAALALIFMRNGRLDSPINLARSEERALERLGSNIGRCVIALESLRDSLVRFSQESGGFAWQFRHPTVGDAYAAILAQGPEFIDIFIQGSRPERLIRQVTCGDVGLENAIIVPKSLFSLMIAKLNNLPETSDFLLDLQSQWKLQGFLAHRCSKEFLSLFLEHNPELLDHLCNRTQSYRLSTELQLAKRLHDVGLLPDQCRRILVDEASTDAVQGNDPGALNNAAMRSLFTEDEFEELVRAIRIELVPQLTDIRLDLEFNGPEDQQPEDYMQPHIELLESLNKEFEDDESVDVDIEEEILLAEQWIADNTPLDVDTDRWELEMDKLPESPQSARSVFDDIDTYDVVMKS